MISGLVLGLSKAMAQAPVANFSATPTTGCGPLTVLFTDQSTNTPTNWSWDFGNGQTSYTQNPIFTYTVAGTYTVKLIVRNSSGSAAIVKTDYITVYPYPSPSFTSNLTLACTPANIQFTDQSTPGQGSITSWAWDFGDGATSNQESPEHTYTQTGYFDVTLKVTNSEGCSYGTTVSRYLRVVGGIQPAFAFNQSSTSCTAPFIGQLLNQSAGPGNLSFAWTISNGASPANSADTSPVVTFPSTGQYNVVLQVGSSLGCNASVQQTLPFSNFSAILNGPTTACVNTPATYSDGSTPAPNTITWNFGDGTSSNTSSVSKTFSATGSYPVKVVNTYSTCADSTVETVQVVNPPTAAFTSTPSPASACKPSLTVNFTDQTTPTPIGWLWDFGDGQTSTQQNPSHTYTTPGNFNVSLTATGAGGCTNSLEKITLVQIQAPTVIIGGRLGACTAATPANNTIDPAAIVTTVDPVSSYLWSAPGSVEGSSTSANPVFTYATPNNYTITVTVTTTGGCQASATTQVNIGNPTPANFTINSTPVCGNGTVSFNATASTPADQWYWDFGDGTNTGLTNLPTASHSYGKPGPFNVTLTLTDHGCPTTSTQIVTVKPAVPNFGYTINCPNALSVSFTDSSFTDGALVSYTWDFGDGTLPQTITAAPWTPNHIYASAGLYNVTLTIVDGSCTTTITKPVFLGAVNADFGIQPSLDCRNTITLLYSTSTVTPANNAFISNFHWQINGAPFVFGGSTFTFTPTANGLYTINMYATDVNGCKYNAPTHTVQVNGPTANFTIPATGGGCENAAVPFTDNSTPNPAAITTWSWNFGDGQTSSQQNPTHSYADTGYFRPLLTVTDAQGCTDTISKTIQITSPIANFAGPDSFYCPGVPFTFTDSSRGYITGESWNFGDGNSSANPVNTYLNNGSYNVTLTVTDKYNCTNAITKPVHIQKPIAAFNIYDTTGICTPLETIFAAHGQYYDSLYWKFGDATTSTLDSTTHFYNNYGIDTAKLFLQGPGGCLDSASRRVLVYNPNTASSMTYNPLSHCDSLTVNFNLSPPPFTSFTLDFRDGNHDSSGNLTPSHKYKNLGSYQPEMILTDQTGCIVDYDGLQGPVMVLGSTPFFTVDKHAFCDSSIVNFTDYTISNDGFAKETYVFGDGSPNQSQSPATGAFNIAHDYNQPGLWTAMLQVSTNSGCQESYSDTIHVYQTPHPVITIPAITCAGLIQFQGSITAPQVDSISWDWNFGNGETSQLQSPIVNMATGNYLVTLKASVPFGCNDTTSSSVTVNPLPEIKGPHEISTPVGIPIGIPFTYSPNVVSYVWTPTSNLNCADCANPVATLIFSTTYTVNVTDANGCSAADTILIKTICNDKNYWFPNTFSPNGDGVNDWFYPRGTSLYNIQSLTIFNRWGQMVFQRRDFPANAQNMGWDGTFGGKLAPSDAYVYIAEVICENAQVVTLSGNVTLIR